MATKTSTASSAVSTDLRRKVLWVDLQRPDVLNAINHEMIQGLNGALEIARGPEVRAVVIRGTGRAFCAGADLFSVPGAVINIDEMKETVSRVAEVVNQIAELPKPVVAGVNGIAAAGGLEIVLACDLVVAAQGARLADAHSNYGLLPGAGGSARLARAVGPALAKRLMFTGDYVAVEDLVRSGLIAEVVPPEQLDASLEELAGKLAERSPRVLAAMKRLVDGNADATLEEALRAETAELSTHLESSDLMIGLRAFRNGARPQFDD